MIANAVDLHQAFDPADALFSGSTSDFAENGFVR
jgi:hypothetical protein